MHNEIFLSLQTDRYSRLAACCGLRQRDERRLVLLLHDGMWDRRACPRDLHGKCECHARLFSLRKLAEDMCQQDVAELCGHIGKRSASVSSLPRSNLGRVAWCE